MKLSAERIKNMNQKNILKSLKIFGLIIGPLTHRYDLFYEKFRGKPMMKIFPISQSYKRTCDYRSWRYELDILPERLELPSIKRLRERPLIMGNQDE